MNQWGINRGLLKRNRKRLGVDVGKLMTMMMMWRKLRGCFFYFCVRVGWVYSKFHMCHGTMKTFSSRVMSSPSLIKEFQWLNFYPTNAITIREYIIHSDIIHNMPYFFQTMFSFPSVFVFVN
jgi:hypothetical protein